MAPMPALMTIAQLYPPQAKPEVASLARSIVVARDIGGNGTWELRREITKDERSGFAARLEELDSWLAPALAKDVRREVEAMLIGWGASGKSMTPAEAVAISHQYATVLGGCPLWGVQRACQRWAGGSVAPAEVGLDPAKGGRIDWNFPPSAAMVNIIARETVQPWGQEAARIRKILESKPALALPEPAGDGKGFQRLQEWLAERKAVEKAEQEARRKAVDPAQQHADCLRAWAAMGLAPPKVDPGKYLAMPTTYLALGWRIVEITEMGETRRYLAPPDPGDPPPEVETRPARSGTFRQVGAALDDEIPF